MSPFVRCTLYSLIFNLSDLLRCKILTDARMTTLTISIRTTREDPRVLSERIVDPSEWFLIIFI